MALILFSGQTVQAQSTAFSRALAEAVSADEALAGFYRKGAYASLWTGPADQDRRAALMQALADAPDQGLPAGRYDRAGLVAALHNAVTEGDRGRLEAALSQVFLSYARDLSSGVLTPSKVDPGIVREIDRPDPAALMQGFAAATEPRRYLRDLAPDAPEYARLVKEKLRLEAVIAQEGWGPQISASSLVPGSAGPEVIALRDRLMRLGYLGHGAQASYDRAITRAVQRFQLDSGITANGEAGESTIAALNTPPEARLRAVVVALERLRWLGDTPLGARHIWVNQPDFTAKIVDDGRTSFQTRVVIGKNVEDQRSPEFSDLMEFMVINPSWGVPRSIIVKEYLPLLQRNSNAVRHLDVIDGNGRVVPRGAVNFAAYSASSFPFGLRQPPSDGNALGKVKFMFPNTHNIYLHDTPAKNLFANEVRAYSHGCIRLGDPVDFAYALLARQTDDPKGVFQTELASKRESNVSLDEPLPVHLVYFTAWPTAKGQIGYRNDVYGRDARIFDALSEAGVVLGAERG
jgi:murein L,D-transpeptidase YcbB/YkuD